MRTLRADDLWVEGNEAVREAVADYLEAQLPTDTLRHLHATSRDVYSVRFGEGLMVAEVGWYDGDDLVSEFVTFPTSAPPPALVLNYAMGPL